MIRGDHSLKLFLLVLGDLALLYAALFSALYLRYYPATSLGLIQQHLTPFTFIFGIWMIIFGSFGLYDLRLMKNSKQFLYRLTRAIATNTILTMLVLYLFPLFEIEPRRNLFLIALIATAFIFIWRSVFNLTIRTPSSHVLLFGPTPEAIELAEYVSHNPQLGQKAVGFLANGEEPCNSTLPLPCYSTHERKLRDIVRETRADTIVISPEIKENKTLVDLLFQVIPFGIGIVEFPAFYERLTGKIPLSLLGKVWFLENLIGVRRQGWEFFKRMLDILLSTLAAIPAVLLTPLVALAIKLDSKGPVFYYQTRLGRHGTRFSLLKFRSMVENADAMSGYKINRTGVDPRLTRVGKIIRATYLDELPQLWNVFKGEMSFVGPRPERPEYVDELKKKIPFYQMRLLVPPGLTGWAQVNMEDDASVEDAPMKMQYDLYYIKNRSLVLELLIVLRTLFLLVQRTGR